jgi:hypothetical protein
MQPSGHVGARHGAAERFRDWLNAIPTAFDVRADPTVRIELGDTVSLMARVRAVA